MARTAPENVGVEEAVGLEELAVVVGFEVVEAPGVDCKEAEVSEDVMQGCCCVGTVAASDSNWELCRDDMAYSNQCYTGAAAAAEAATVTETGLR